ncbi:hypothetical protein B0H14DRAFT_3862595 [Mycena olivaceomarginata]|nr:hypothetical protein B0H14DRAFT_3862595 [Mycena olivaceomarginata]
MRHFAQELVDDVIDSWALIDRDGADAMKVCGLVCKRWLPRSRFHLFSRVTLDADNLASFIEIIDCNSLPMLSFIQQLKLRFAGRPLDGALLDRIHGCPNLTGIEIWISEMSRNLEDNTQFYRTLQTHLPLLASNATSLSRFDFRLPSHPLVGIPAGAIIDIIGCIPSVECVTVHGSYSYIIPDPEFARRGAAPHLRPLQMHTLEIRTYQGVQLLTSSLLSQHVLPNLRSLTLRAGLDPIEEFIQRVGAQVESLTLSFLEAPRAVPTIGRFVTYTTKLRDLQVFLLEPSPILNILSVLPLYNWDTISFVLINEDRRTVIHWGGIDHALTDARFCSLRRFILKRIVDVDDPTPECIPETKVFMPLANKRGILE